MNKIPVLHVLIGISGSGKSTIAKKIAEEENAIIVSSDNLRKELFGDESRQDVNELVFNEYHKRIKNTLLKGKSVIADATNLTMKSRRAIFANLKKVPHKKEAVIVVRDVVESILANNLRDRVVPEDIIRAQVARFQIPFYEEGFDSIYFVQVGDTKTAADLNTLVSLMNNFDQKNHHHAETLDIHNEDIVSSFRRMGYETIAEAAGLYHDIGKLFTQSISEDGEAHYYGHENIGAYNLLLYKEAICNKHNLTYNDFLDVAFLTNYHMLPYSWETNKILEKKACIFGSKFSMLMDFNKCDREASIENNIEIKNDIEMQVSMGENYE